MIGKFTPATLTLLANLTCTLPALAENVSGAAQLLCAPHTVRLCLETGDCYPASPLELGVPEFIVIDTEERRIRTTEAAGANRSSEFASFNRMDGVLTLQGVENERAFSFIIHEETGLLTASIARDGFAVSAFGTCTVN